MAFEFHYNDFGAPQRRTDHILATNGEAFQKGEAVKIASGRITKAGPTDAIYGFTNQKLAAGTDQKLEVAIAREGDWFDAPYTGTAAVGFVIAANAVAITADGLSVDAATVTGGALTVILIDTNGKKARVKVSKRQI
jgi:hypothetical protein